MIDSSASSIVDKGKDQEPCPQSLLIERWSGFRYREVMAPAPTGLKPWSTRFPAYIYAKDR